MDNSVDLPGYKHYLDRATGRRPRVRVAFLDVEETGHEDHEVSGVALWVDEADLPALDARERNYRRVDVTQGVSDESLEAPVWTYTGLESSRARAREEPPPVVSREYLDAVRAGLAGDPPDPPSEVRDLELVLHPPLTEGERWAREQLAELLRRRFTPPAIAAFLAASQRRANDVRRARPELARQAWTWSAGGAAAWLALARAGGQPYRDRARAGLAWWAACAVMLDWHLGMVETDDGRPRRLSSADAMTLARAWLVPVAAVSPTPVVCGVAALSDVLDGRLARRAGPTRIGRDLEGLVDAAFAAAALRGARRLELISPAAVAAELTRLGAGFAYAVYAYFGRAQAPDPALIRAARLTTPVRAAGLVAAGLGRPRLAGGLLGSGALLSLVTTARAWRSG
jgi:phosphatidylglycerophosphate synthase